jgi:hypothetical protein
LSLDQNPHLSHTKRGKDGATRRVALQKRSNQFQKFREGECLPD